MKNSLKIRFALLPLYVFMGMFFCFTSIAQPVQQPKDPLHFYNYFMFKVNDKIDKYFMKPVAEFYNKVMPEPLNRGIHNFFQNILTVPTILNDVLQANFYQATSDSWRLLLNSTVGVGGFFDVGTDIGLTQNTNGFGLTLARWGWKDSTYFVLPMLGPSTFRDALGLGVDYYTVPTSYLDDVALRNSLLVVGAVDKRAYLLQYQDIYEQVALDPYVFTRNSYLQQRAYLIHRNEEVSDPYTAEDTQNSEEDYYIDE